MIALFVILNIYFVLLINSVVTAYSRWILVPLFHILSVCT